MDRFSWPELSVTPCLHAYSFVARSSEIPGRGTILVPTRFTLRCLRLLLFVRRVCSRWIHLLPAGLLEFWRALFANDIPACCLRRFSTHVITFGWGHALIFLLGGKQGGGFEGTDRTRLDCLVPDAGNLSLFTALSHLMRVPVRYHAVLSR